MSQSSRRNRDETRAALITAAVSLVEAGRPLEARAVAKKARRSLGTLTHHFEKGGLDALREEIALYALRRLNGSLRSALKLHSNPMARAKALAHAYVDFAWQNKQLYRLVRTEQWGSRHVEELNLENWDLGRATIAELQLEGVLRRSPIDEQLAVIWTACHGVASLALDRFAAPANPARLLDLVLDALFAGLGPD